jgi:late competence protein required for DNA uptake (superfamily II DNA/RNA helicase)
VDTTAVVAVETSALVVVAMVTVTAATSEQVVVVPEATDVIVVDPVDTFPEHFVLTNQEHLHISPQSAFMSVEEEAVEAVVNVLHLHHQALMDMPESGGTD